MTNTCAGWEIVCPDGRVRHYPFHNHGDAACDAESYSDEGCGVGYPLSPLERAQPSCPGGNHDVRAIVLSHQAKVPSS